MNLLAAGLVTISSSLHLGWNTTMRAYSGSLRHAWFLILGGGLFAALITVIFSIPVLQLVSIWPWVVATIVCHTLYYSALTMSYRNGELTRVYPATRGGGIVFASLLAFGLFDEVPSAPSIIGMLLIVAAVVYPALRSRKNLATLGWIIAVAFFIACYSAIDSHSMHFVSPWPYISVQSLGTAVLMAPWAFSQKDATSIYPALIAGIASILSYVLILYAYQRAQVGPVLALRQVAIAATPVVGRHYLKEPWDLWSIAFSLMILAGCALIVWR